MADVAVVKLELSLITDLAEHTDHLCGHCWLPAVWRIPFGILCGTSVVGSGYALACDDCGHVETERLE